MRLVDFISAKVQQFHAETNEIPNVSLAPDVWSEFLDDISELIKENVDPFSKTPIEFAGVIVSTSGYLVQNTIVLSPNVLSRVEFARVYEWKREIRTPVTVPPVPGPM